MGSSTWPCPAGVFFVQVECFGSGAMGNSPFPQPWAAAGGGGGSYSRKRIAVIPGNIYNVVWGDGTTFNAEPDTDFGSGALVTGPGQGTNGGAVNPGADVSFAGGNGGAAVFVGGDGTGAGGGGGAGRAGGGGNGAIGNTTGTPGGGGSNAPSASIGTGGAGGAPGAGPGGFGSLPGGGGGGMGSKNVIGPDLSGVGSPGAILIYDDTGGGGFNASNPTIGSFGSPPAPPPVNVKLRKSAYQT